MALQNVFEGVNKEDELEEGEEGEISWNLFLHSICYFCTLIQNLLLGIVPKQSLILFLQCTAESYATTGSAVVLVKSCNDPNVDEVVLVMEEQSTEPHEGSRHSQILSFQYCLYLTGWIKFIWYSFCIIEGLERIEDLVVRRRVYRFEA